MEEKNINQNKEIIVGKNIIHNNFESTNFMSNFRELLKNVKNENDSGDYPNYYILNNEAGVKESIDSFNFINNNKEDINKDKQTKADKKYIIHLVPSKNSNFYNFIKKKKKEVLNMYGADDTYKYDTHISLTGFFFCDNINTFIKTLYIYFFYYAKLYYIYRKLLLINLFFHIHLKKNNDTSHTIYTPNKYNDNNYINNTIIYESENAKKKKQKYCETKNEEIKHTKYCTYLQKYEIKNSVLLYKNSNMCNNDKKQICETHVLKTNDGYVIIPILCDWIKKLIENFQFLLKNNSFKSVNKRKLNNRDDDIFRNNLFKNEFFYKLSKKNNIYNFNNLQIRSKTTLTKQFSQNNKKYNNVSSSPKSIIKKNNYTLAYPSPHIFLDNNCKFTTNEYQTKRVHSSYTTVLLIEKNINSSENENGHNFNKNHQNKSKITLLKSENDNNEKHNKIVKKLPQETNIIKYKYSNTNVNLTNFRIKRCSHISLASNRDDKEIKNNIANMYNDIKYHFRNCPWDLVMFECDENNVNQDKNINNFLKEIFRFKNFAIS
ncbi:conserved Plasmodium protein, unknown function [Plasmodium berghei]|uniref:Uncharacterized protein n=3 Tax=Plasmodium berghei TaxID=5821 RepID=A0A509AG93_PLABA|nr:conserved Plasmodium protein, unknown function [Plasmodium berghei ANKA]CXI07142.1 conserved Plasmodium protein, unknown function [Plasmodium berghei]SCL92561.1 conserved Plasmodium protein, unknown function [Plasmodium berghei]SCM15665.1 conserved Plasmodium protein, unknown function [Plasmodium berghei]VUC54441.1 conserved Plasmodium protein, unknown function [Plasmodium berghei ANKA]|eukprot:XP_034420270.1 conserved Plasmodium protein, unknown function [Plasmodium berghei ANKA]